MESIQRSFLLTVVAFAAAAHAATADGVPHWQQAGWGGGGYYWAAVYHPTQDGLIYMAGDCCGVYKTEDHGRHWRIVNSGLASYAVYSLAVDRTRPQIVYASTEDGLCKSTDAGEHWQTIPHTGPKELRLTGERERSIHAIAVDPTNGDILYAASPAGKVYKSTDAGQTWAVSYEKTAPAEENGALRIQFGKINGEYYGDFALPVALPAGAQADACSGIGFSLKGDGTMPKDSFLILKTRGGIAYRSKNLRAIYKETDWREVVLNADDFVLDPDDLKAHPEHAAAARAGVDWASVTRLDLACSGALPTEATVGKFGTFFFVVSSAAAKPRRVVFHDFAHDKAPQTFGNLHVGAPLSGTVYSVAVSAANPSYVVAATQDAGLVLSRDAGRTWHALGTPAKAASAVFDPADPRVIYGAFFKGGLLKSTDAGQHWSTLLQADGVIDVAVSPDHPRTLYAIGSKDWNGAFYRSQDGGETWANVSKVGADTASNPTLDGVFGGTANLSAPRMIALSPTNPRELFLAANWRSCLSTDGGLSWTERDRGADISCVTDIRFHKGRTYVTAMDEGTFVSEDGGGHWRQLWPLKHTPGLSGHNWRVAATEVNGAERLISTVTPWYKTPTCVVRSDDGGKTFGVVTTGLPDYTIWPNTMWGQGHPRALAVDPNDPQLVYLGIDGDPANGKCGGGLFKSTDGGATWAQLAHQPGSRRMFYGLAVDPTDSRRLYWGACGNGGGVWRSEDRGASWSLVFRNETFVWDVLATAQGTVYCSGQQLWRSTDHGATWKALTAFKEQRPMVALEVNSSDPAMLWVATTMWNSQAAGGVFKSTDGGASWREITGDLPCVRPQILRYNPDTRELWAGHVGLYKIKQ
jgi:photosystem II stability/assembly factor-like uncharacterized protein